MALNKGIRICKVKSNVSLKIKLQLKEHRKYLLFGEGSVRGEKHQQPTHNPKTIGLIKLKTMEIRWGPELINYISTLSKL